MRVPRSFVVGRLFRFGLAVAVLASAGASCRTDGDAKKDTDTDGPLMPEPPGDPGAPNRPSRLIALGASKTAVELAWTDASTDESGFVVERASARNEDWSSVGTAAANATSFSDPSLAPATTYRYRVFAQNAKGRSASSNVATATTQVDVAAPLSIPTQHPRLWFTPERLAKAKAWYAKNPFEPKDDEKDELAFKYLMTGDKALARKAIDWLKTFTLDVGRSVNDDARWSGERALLVFDWCFDEMTESERAMLIERWNGYVETLNGKDWGSSATPGPANNYFWGYLRNGIEWAIASWHENDKAPALLNHAMNERWEAFKTYGAGGGAGGVPAEGSQYGRYMLAYAAVPLTTAMLLGRNMWEETSLFKSSVFYLAHSLSPDLTTSKNGKTGYETFPYADDDGFKNGSSASSIYAGAFMGTAVDVWRDTPVGGYAQRFLDIVKPPMPHYIEAVMPAVPARSFDDMPVDYFAPGIGFFYLRNKWDKNAMVLNLQLGWPLGADHRHLDAGTFQIWRKGRWLSRETAGYDASCAMPGWKGQKEVRCPATVLHNGLLFEGYGLANAYHRGDPKVLRLESTPEHAFAAVDLTPVYLADSNHPERDLNPHAAQVIREFVFIRALETLVVFDRMKASASPKSAEEVNKTFLLHFEAKPTVSGNVAEMKLGGQIFRATTLLPKSAESRVIDEGEAGQFRWEVDARGADPGFLLHVLQGKDEGGDDVGATLTETTDGYEVLLKHPKNGQAKVMFQKGMTSAGGKFGFSVSGDPTVRDLPVGVQEQLVTDDGPVWR